MRAQKAEQLTERYDRRLQGSESVVLGAYMLPKVEVAGRVVVCSSPPGRLHEKSILMDYEAIKSKSLLLLTSTQTTTVQQNDQRHHHGQ